MCELCSTNEEERKAAKRQHMEIAHSLDRLTTDYTQLATGSVKPHTPEAKAIGERARHMIRVLVEEWF